MFSHYNKVIYLVTLYQNDTFRNEHWGMLLSPSVHHRHVLEKRFFGGGGGGGGSVDWLKMP